MSRACGETIGPRIRICRFVDVSARCSGSNRPDQHNGSCPFTPPSKTRSTSNAISFPAIRSALSEAKRFRVGGRQLRPELERALRLLVRPAPSSRDNPPSPYPENTSIISRKDWRRGCLNAMKYGSNRRWHRGHIVCRESQPQGPMRIADRLRNPWIASPRCCAAKLGSVRPLKKIGRHAIAADAWACPTEFKKAKRAFAAPVHHPKAFQRLHAIHVKPADRFPGARILRN